MPANAGIQEYFFIYHISPDQVRTVPTWRFACRKWRYSGGLHIYHFFKAFLNPARPIKPNPKRSRVAGSGTVSSIEPSK